MLITASFFFAGCQKEEGYKETQGGPINWNYLVCDHPYGLINKGGKLESFFMFYMEPNLPHSMPTKAKDNIINRYSEDDECEYMTFDNLKAGETPVKIVWVRNKKYSFQNDNLFNFLSNDIFTENRFGDMTKEEIDRVWKSYFVGNKFSNTYTEDCPFDEWVSLDFYRKYCASFYKVYTFEFNGVEIYRNESAKADDVWDEWFASTTKSFDYHGFVPLIYIFDENYNFVSVGTDADLNEAMNIH